MPGKRRNIRTVPNRVNYATEFQSGEYSVKRTGGMYAGKKNKYQDCT
jgi:hypothetical protein